MNTDKWLLGVCSQMLLFLQVCASDSSENESGGSPSLAVIVVASTFSVGLVVGSAWCYCMSTVCKTRQSDQKHARLSSASPRGTDYVRDCYPRSRSPQPRSESPISFASRSASPVD